MERAEAGRAARDVRMLIAEGWGGVVMKSLAANEGTDNWMLMVRRIDGPAFA